MKIWENFEQSRAWESTCLICICIYIYVYIYTYIYTYAYIAYGYFPPMCSYKPTSDWLGNWEKIHLESRFKQISIFRWQTFQKTELVEVSRRKTHDLASQQATENVTHRGLFNDLYAPLELLIISNKDIVGINWCLQTRKKIVEYVMHVSLLQIFCSWLFAVYVMLQLNDRLIST